MRHLVLGALFVVLVVISWGAGGGGRERPHERHLTCVLDLGAVQIVVVRA
jgi:hypothetical protein